MLYKSSGSVKTNLIAKGSFDQNGGFFVLKKMIAFVFAVGSFGLVAAAPTWTLRAIPSATCITPARILYEKQVNANGTVEAQETRELYLETPVIADSVLVSVGDFVRKGQPLARINTALTRQVLEQSIPTAAFFQELSQNAELSDLMELYTALQGSTLEVDTDSFQNLIQQLYGFSEEQPASNSYLYIPEVLTAPIDGIVADVGIKSNMLTRSAKPLVTISDQSSFVAMVTVGESYASDIRVGDLAQISGTGLKREYQGHVSKIYPVAHKAANGLSQETVVDLEIAIDDPDEQLKSGFTIRAAITTGQSREMMTIPYEAIQQDENNIEYVYLAQGSVPVRRNIKTGLELLEGVEILEGLQEDDLLLANAEIAEAANRVQLKRG